jgi:cytochrome c2
MRRAILVFLFGGLVCMLSSKSATARAPYLKEFKAKYGEDPAYGELIDKTKCYICHVGSKDKKKRNEYGMALSKIIGKNEKDAGKISTALGKVEEEKSAGGKTFGELIKAHELPTKPQKDD